MWDVKSARLGEAAPAAAFWAGSFRPALDQKLIAKDEQMTDFGHDGGVTSARLIGAVAGSAISLVYLLPKHRREAAVRFLTGLACGLIFGGPTGVWGAGQLGLEGRLSPAEIMLAGATLASFTAWWGLGVLVRLTGRAGHKVGG